MYISGGFNVYPAEVEQALMRMDGVADVAVVGVPDERMGEVGKAYVVRRRSTPDDVIAYAKEKLANFKVPRQVELVDVAPPQPVRQGAQDRAERPMAEHARGTHADHRSSSLSRCPQPAHLRNTGGYVPARPAVVSTGSTSGATAQPSLQSGDPRWT